MSAVIGAGVSYGAKQCSSSSTPAQLAAVSTAVTTRRAQSAGIVIKALSTNAGLIYVGDSSVTTSTGFELSAKESVTLPVDDPSRIYILSSTGTNEVRWICL